MRRLTCTIWLFVIVGLASCSGRDNLMMGLSVQPEKSRPNIVLIMADDLGISDLGSYGGEINTPNIDALAQSGTRFTQFYVASTCSPTRAMLLSGTDNHAAGLGSMNGLQSSQQLNQPGYEGVLSKNVVTFVSLLRDAGYHTYMAGKWHLGKSDNLPSQRGFEQAVSLLQGGGSHFDNTGVINKHPVANYYENGKEIELPTPFYSSSFYTDKLIEYIEKNRGDKTPFFAYASYTAPHWPLQAPQHFIKKYQGVYAKGYEAIRQQRLKNMVSAGIIKASVLPYSSAGLWPTWEELSALQQAKEIRRMQVYAAMVEALDYHIGRLINYLHDINELDNTLILFMSDNGADGNDPFDLFDNATWIPKTFDNSLENMGHQGSFIAYGPNWAGVSATPYRMYKGFTTEGGIISPMIVKYPKDFNSNRISHEFTSIMDIAPTILEFASVDHPGNEYKGRKVETLKGKSLISYLKGETKAVHSSDYIMGWELFNRRAIRQGDWKLLWINEPWGKQAWELYNLANDPAEMNNLAVLHPEKRQQMLHHWQAYIEQYNIIIPERIDMKFTNGNKHFSH